MMNNSYNVFSLTEHSNKNIIVQGFNGTGKTRFALQFVRLQEQYYDSCYYMMGEDLYKLQNLRDCLIIIDDLDYYFDKRAWNKKEQADNMKILSKLLSRTRHNGCTYILISRINEINSFLVGKSAIFIFLKPVGKYFVKYTIVDLTNYKCNSIIMDLRDLPSSWNLSEGLSSISFR